MPLIFADSYSVPEPKQPSPLEDFMTGLFGGMGQGIKQLHEDKREDRRFQQTLAANMRKLGMDQAQLDESSRHNRALEDASMRTNDRLLKSQEAKDAATAADQASGEAVTQGLSHWDSIRQKIESGDPSWSADMQGFMSSAMEGMNGDDAVKFSKLIHDSTLQAKKAHEFNQEQSARQNLIGEMTNEMMMDGQDHQYKQDLQSLSMAQLPSSQLQKALGTARQSRDARMKFKAGRDSALQVAQQYGAQLQQTANPNDPLSQQELQDFSQMLGIHAGDPSSSAEKIGKDIETHKARYQRLRSEGARLALQQEKFQAEKERWKQEQGARAQAAGVKNMQAWKMSQELAEKELGTKLTFDATGYELLGQKTAEIYARFMGGQQPQQPAGAPAVGGGSAVDDANALLESIGVK